MASVYDNYSNLLSQGSPTGDSDAETWSNIDPLGDEIFGWGNASKNRAIRNRIAAIEAMQGQISAAQRQRLEQAIQSNTAEWDQLTDSILGADGQKLRNFYNQIQASDQANYDKLEQGLGGYQSVEDLFANPNFFGDVGDVTNAAKPSDATVAAQRGALAKMQALSDPTESAAERFSRMMAEREAEANMKGARDSIASDLKARGAYGSGAEVVSNMMSQADAANRRYMADLAAQAQAQQRASQMLGMGADLSSKMRASETQEGQLANQVSMFNNQLNQALMNQRSGLQMQGRAADNQRGDKAAYTLYQAGTDVNKNKRGDMASEIGTTTGLTRGGIDLRNAGEASLSRSDDVFREWGDKRKAGLYSEVEDPILGGGIG